MLSRAFLKKIGGQIMDIKKRLYRYSDLKLEHEQLKERIDSLREQLTSIRSQTFDDVVACSGNSDKIGDMISTLSNLETLYIRKSNELMKEIIFIERLINQLESRDRILMRKKYIECKTWEEICVEMNYSYRNVLYIHGNILSKLKKIA